MKNCTRTCVAVGEVQRVCNDKVNSSGTGAREQVSESDKKAQEESSKPSASFKIFWTTQLFGIRHVASPIRMALKIRRAMDVAWSGHQKHRRKGRRADSANKHSVDTDRKIVGM